MFKRLLIWVACLALWTWALLMPDPDGFAQWLILGARLPTPSEDSGGWDLLDFVRSPAFSKAVHVMGYASLTILAGWVRARRANRLWLLVFLSGHAFATEFLQAFVPTRHPSWIDVGFDHLGIALGLALAWKYWIVSPRADDPSSPT